MSHSEPSVLLVDLQIPSGSWVNVGTLHKQEQRNWFEFSVEYWHLPDRPVLGQIFEERGRVWKPTARVALPHWFSHLLPEGQLRQAVADVSGTNSKREFELIVRLGKDDLPGAVRIQASSELCREREVPSMEEGGDEGDNEDPLLKFSLAGAQLKFSLYGNQRKGLTVPVKGQAGNYIAKFPDGRPGFDGVPESEAACIELARAVGISTPEYFLVSPLSIGGLKRWAAGVSANALAVKRFDRRDDDVRVHMEEFAQIRNIGTATENAKYKMANLELIAVLAQALCGMDSVGEVIDRIVLNILIGNGDAHLKNWAVIYPDGKTPQLSPIYDVCPTVIFLPNDDLGLKLGGTRSFSDFNTRSFDDIGIRTGFGVANARDQALKAREKLLDKWATLRDFLGRERYEILSRRLRRLPIVKN